MYHPSLATIDGEGGARAKAACTETIADKTGLCAPTRSQRTEMESVGGVFGKGVQGRGNGGLNARELKAGEGVLCVLRGRLVRVGSQDRIAVIVFFERDCRVQCNKLEAFGKKCQRRTVAICSAAAAGWAQKEGKIGLV